MQAHKNHYEILGVGKTASTQQIKKEYKKLALKHHPDKNPDDKEGAKKRFTKIAEAYSVLSDADQRAAYDRQLQRPPFEPFQPQHRNYQRPHQTFQNFQNFNTHQNFQGFQMPNQHQNFQNIFNQFRKFQPSQQRQPQQPRFRYEKRNPENVNFASFEESFRPPKFERFNSFSGAFGSRFTFEMAEEIFNSAFQEPKQIQGSHNSLHRANSMREEYQPVKEYVPKNSTLLSEKKIEKNGKQVLVKKYSISDRDGGTHTQTIETVVGKSQPSTQSSSFQSQFPSQPPSQNQTPPPPHKSHEQEYQNLFKKRSMNEKSSFTRMDEELPPTKGMRKGGIAALERLSSMRGTERK